MTTVSNAISPITTFLWCMLIAVLQNSFGLYQLIINGNDFFLIGGWVENILASILLGFIVSYTSSNGFWYCANDASGVMYMSGIFGAFVGFINIMMWIEPAPMGIYIAILIALAFVVALATVIDQILPLLYATLACLWSYNIMFSISIGGIPSLIACLVILVIYISSNLQSITLYQIYNSEE